MKRSLFSGIFLVALLLPVAGLEAQTRPTLDEPIQPHPEGESAINQIRSPFCPGLMLEVCPTTQAKLLRDSIQMMAHDGASADSIVQWMLANHGDEYRAVPQARGSGLWAWVMPPLALIAGLIAIILVLRHLRGRQEVGPLEVEEISEEDESVLAAALSELKSSEEVPF